MYSPGAEQDAQDAGRDSLAAVVLRVAVTGRLSRRVARGGLPGWRFDWRGWLRRRWRSAASGWGWDGLLTRLFWFGFVGHLYLPVLVAGYRRFAGAQRLTKVWHGCRADRRCAEDNGLARMQRAIGSTMLIAMRRTSHPDRPPYFPWPVRSLVVGAVGTMAMTVAYWAERRVRAGKFRGAKRLADGRQVRGMATDQGLDYDDTVVPGQIVANILHLPDAISSHPGEIAIALRWGYGSAFGFAHVWLRHRYTEPTATLLFGGALMTVTFSMFPALGGTPPPWHWPKDVLLTSLGTHAAYVLASAITDDLTR